MGRYFKIIGTVVFIFSISTFSWANAYFQKPEDIVIGTAESYDNVLKSVFQLMYKGESLNKWGKCSNSFISQNGHFLTALHCIKGCVLEHEAYGAFFEQAYVNSAQGPKLNDAFVPINFDKMKNKTCKVMSPTTGELEDVEFVAAGTAFNLGNFGPIGLLSHVMKKNPQRALTLVANGLANNLDFAILKFKQKQNQNCLRIASDSSADELNHQNVWTYTFPGETSWTDEDLADGKTALISQGQVLSSYLESETLVTHSEKMGLTDPDPKVLAIKKSVVLDLYGTKITNAPIHQGSSGGPVLNEEGELVGNISFTGGTTDETQPGATYFLTVQEMKTFVVDLFPELDTDAIFDCPSGNTEMASVE